MMNDEFLAAMKQVEEFSTALKTTSWVWGGLTTDVYEGRFLREHDDLDCLTLNLHTLMQPLANRFQDAGWKSRELVNGDLKLERSGIKIHLGHVVFSEEVRWTHNGDLGSLYFPVEWLVQKPRPFYSIEVHVVAPELQYVLLDDPHLLNPDWTPREKDLVAKEYLKSWLAINCTATENLRTKIHN
jgi:hypothetical protein